MTMMELKTILLELPPGQTLSFIKPEGVIDGGIKRIADLTAKGLPRYICWWQDVDPSNPQNQIRREDGWRFLEETMEIIADWQLQGLININNRMVQDV